MSGETPTGGYWTCFCGERYARHFFCEAVRQVVVEGTKYEVSKGEKPVAMIVPIDWYERARDALAATRGELPLRAP